MMRTIFRLSPTSRSTIPPFATSLRHNSYNNNTSSKPTPPNFYTLFPRSIPLGAPPAGPFSIDLRALQREFFALQQKAHPDTPEYARNPTGPSSAFINKAYTTLRDPLARAQYLLSLRDMDVVEGEMLAAGDQALLMEVLEAQEAIEAVESEEELGPLVHENKERVKESLGVLERAFASADWEGAKREVVRLRYWENVGQTIGGWEKGKPVALVH